MVAGDGQREGTFDEAMAAFAEGRKRYRNALSVLAGVSSDEDADGEAGAVEKANAAGPHAEDMAGPEDEHIEQGG